MLANSNLAPGYIFTIIVKKKLSSLQRLSRTTSVNSQIYNSKSQIMILLMQNIVAKMQYWYW